MLEPRLNNQTRKTKLLLHLKIQKFDIMYGEGISKVGEILDLDVFDIVKKSVSWFKAMVTRNWGQGRDAVKNY